MNTIIQQLRKTKILNFYPTIQPKMLSLLVFAIISSSFGSKIITPQATPTLQNVTLLTCPWDTAPAFPESVLSPTSSKLDFSLSLFHSLYVPGGNLFFSPHSLHSTLLSTLLGAEGETEKELRDLLKINQSKHAILAGIRMENMVKDVTCPGSKNSGVEVRLANKIFIDKGEPLGSCALQHLLGKSSSQQEEQILQQIDMTSDPIGATQIINRWVENITQGHISDLIPPLPAQTRLAVVNGAYFRGVWEHQFKPSRTKLGLFYASSNEVIPTYMMNTKGHFKHGASEELKAYLLELPYEGDTTSMFFLLPPFTPDGIATTIAALNDGGNGAAALARALDSLSPDSIEVVLPRFSLSSTLSLNTALSKLGINTLFKGVAGNSNSSNSNLTGISDLRGFSLNGHGLNIEEGIHRAELEVGEEGATASAGTALIGTRSGRPLQQSRFVANHPFLLGVWDKCRETLLFLGVVHRPEKKEIKR